MADINENPQSEENVVYEYVELEEGQELPEGYEYEYEYVEVPEGETEVSELDIVQQKADNASGEEELASAEEIEAVLRPVNIDAEIEGVLVSESAPVAEEKMPQIEAPGSDISLDALLDDVREPQIEVPVSETFGETDDLPKFEIETPTVVAEESGIPSLDSLLDGENESVPAVAETEVESPFVEPVGIKFQNDDEDAEEMDWVVGEDMADGAAEALVSEVESAPAPTGLPDILAAMKAELQEAKAATEMPVENEVIVQVEEVAPEQEMIPVEEPAPIAEEVVVIEENAVEAAAPVEEVVAVEETAVEAAAPVEEVVAVEETAVEAAAPVEEVVAVEETAVEAAAPVEEVVVAEETAVEAVAPVEEEPLVFDEPALDVEDILTAGEADTSDDLSLADLLNDEPLTEIESLSVPEAVVEESEAAEEVILPTLVEENGIPEIGDRFSENVEPEVSLPVVEAENLADNSAETEVVSEVVAESEPMSEVLTEVVPEVVAVETETAASEVVSEVAPAPVLPPEPEAVSDLLVDSTAEAGEIINPSVELPAVTDCSAEQFELKAQAARLVSKNDGIQSFKGTEALNLLALNDVDFEKNELSAWNLIIFRQAILPLTAKVSELDMPRSSQVNRFVSLVKAGEAKAEFFNEDKLKILNTSESCVAVQGRFVCGDLQTNSGLIVNDMITLPLQECAGKELSFSAPASGLLSGPNGALLYFFNVRGILVPNGEAAKIDAEKLQYKISKWYSGSLNDKYFEFNAQSPSANFEGNDEIKAIHVNVNNSSYGWNVTFDNGLSMNLRDLREYQTRFGKMPSPNGVISYGQTKLTFSKVERIVVYEGAQYFFYN